MENKKKEFVKSPGEEKTKLLKSPIKKHKLKKKKRDLSSNRSYHSISKNGNKEDSISKNRIKADSLSEDCNKADSISKDCYKEDSISKDCYKKDSISADCNKKDSISEDCNKEDSIPADCNKKDSISEDCNKEDSISADYNKKDSISEDCNKEEAAHVNGCNSTDHVNSEKSSDFCSNNAYDKNPNLPLAVESSKAPFPTSDTLFMKSSRAAPWKPRAKLLEWACETFPGEPKCKLWDALTKVRAENNFTLSGLSYDAIAERVRSVLLVNSA